VSKNDNITAQALQKLQLRVTVRKPEEERFDMSLENRHMGGVCGRGVTLNNASD